MDTAQARIIRPEEQVQQILSIAMVDEKHEGMDKKQRRKGEKC